MTSHTPPPIDAQPVAPAAAGRDTPQHAGHAHKHRQRSALHSSLRRLLIPVSILAIVVVLAGLAIGRWNLWSAEAATQSTDNATIRAETASVAPRIAGIVQSVRVQDFQHVKAGDLLVQIDPSDYSIQLAQSEASLASAQAAYDNLDNQIALQRATMAESQAREEAAASTATQAGLERERQEALMKSGFASRQKLEQAVAADQEAQSSLRAAQAAAQADDKQLDVLQGTKLQREADLQLAHANIAAAKLRLDYTRIVAPFDGVVGERKVQEGNYVAIGSNLISVVPMQSLYVIANYKETQLGRLHGGETVDVTVDAFPGLTLQGKVERLSPATGSQFALLPADNATGNFTKVVQRVPVRISLAAGQPLLDRLRPGMSVTTRIHMTGDSALAASL